MGKSRKKKSPPALPRQPRPTPPSRLIWGYALYFFTIIPFLFSGKSMDPVLSLRMMAMAGGLGVALPFIVRWVLAENKPLDAGILRRIFFPALLIFIVINILAVSQATNPVESGFDLSRTLLAAAFLICTVLWISQDPRLIDAISKAISITVLFLSIAGISQYFGMAPFTGLPGNFIVYATMVNKNLLASALLLCLPLVLLVSLKGKTPWRNIALISFGLGIFVIGLAHSRAAWLAGLISFLSAAAGWKLFMTKLDQGGRFYKKDVRRALLIGLMGVISAGGFHLLRTGQAPLLHKELTAANAPMSSLEERLLIWEKSLQMVLDHPWLGVGPGNWKIVLPAYGSEGMRSSQGTLHFVRPHNDYLWILTETGLAGLAAYLFLAGIIAFYLVRIFRDARSADDRLLAVISAAGLLGYAVIAAASFPRERIFHSLMLMTYTAIVITVYHRRFPGRIRKKRPFAAGLLVTLLLPVAAGGWLGWQHYRSEVAARQALALGRQGSPAAQITYMNRAISPWVSLDPSGTPLPLYRGLALAAQNKFEEALEDFQAAERSHPNHILVLNNLAAACQQLGEAEKAEQIFLRILAMSPGMEHTLLNLAAMYYHQQRYEEALRMINRCDPRSTNPLIATYRQAVESKLAEP